MNAGSLSVGAARSGRAEVAGDGVGERRQGDRLPLHGPERRARTVCHVRVAAELGPRIAGVLADAAPQRRAGAPGRQRVGPCSPVGRGDAQPGRAEHLGRGARAAASRRRLAELVDHRRERGDRQPHGRLGVVGQRGEAVERDAGRLDEHVASSGSAGDGVARRLQLGWRTRSTPAGADGGRRGGGRSCRRRRRCPRSRCGGARSAPATSTMATRTAPIRLPGTSSPAARARLGGDPRARARGRRRRGRSGRCRRRRCSPRPPGRRARRAGTG